MRLPIETLAVARRAILVFMRGAQAVSRTLAAYRCILAAAAAGAGCTPAGSGVPDASDTSDAALPSCSALEHVVSAGKAAQCATPPCPVPGTPIRMAADGDTLFFADTARVFRVDTAGLHAVGTPTAADAGAGRPDGGAGAQATVDALWVATGRLLVVSAGQVYAIAEDGSSVVPVGDPLPAGAAYALDDLYAYAATPADASAIAGSELYRVPLAGGPLQHLATLPPQTSPFFLGVDATRAYAVGTYNGRIVAVDKTGGASTQLGLPTYDYAVGFDGQAFLLQRSGYLDGGVGIVVSRIDRDLPSGQSTRLWIDGTIEVVAGSSLDPAPFAAAAIGGYGAGGFILNQPNNRDSEAVVYKLDATGLHLAACIHDGVSELQTPAVGNQFAFAVQTSAGGGVDVTDWSIVRFAR